MKANTLRLLGLVLGLVLAPSLAQAQVRINEVMADNGGSVIAPGGEPSDYIELVNVGATTVNLSGWKIVDSTKSTSTKAFVFPANTTVAPGAYLMLWMDALTNGPGPGFHVTSYSLSAAGEVISLFNGTGTLQDRMTFGLQVKDKSVGRFPNGTGPWTLGTPTPAGTNTKVTLGTQFALRLNEWMPTNSAGYDQDHLEIFNPATNGPVSIGGASGILITGDLILPDTNSPLILSNSFIDSGGFVLFQCDNVDPEPGDPADHVSFRLSSSAGETISMFLSNRTTLIDRVSFGTFTNLPLLGRDISMGRFPDGGTNIVFFYTNHTTLGSANIESEKITNIIVNELLAHTDPPLEDAVELYNPTASSVNIGGWWISNSPDNPYKFRVAANTFVTDGGYKVFYEQSIVNGPPSALGFNPSGTGDAPDFTFNSAHGDNVVLTYFAPSALLNGSNTVYQTVRDFAATENGFSYGNYVKSTGGTDFVPMSSRSFGVDNPSTIFQFRAATGAPNPYPRVGPLVISEIMYHPPDNGTNDNVLDEFVELTSITNGVLPLFDPNYPTNTWSIQGGISFAFPTNVSLPANGRLLVLNFDPVTNAAQLASFRAKFSVAESVPVFGPFGGKLINSSETIYLYKPDPVQLPPHPDAGFVPQVFVERVKYEDRDLWPTNADGGGASLQRVSLTGYANDPTNWFGAAPTAGLPNTQASPEPVQIFAPAMLPGGSFTLTFKTTPGRSYAVEGSSSLLAGSWSPLTNFTATSTNSMVTNQSATSQSPLRFYRAKSL